MDPDVVQKSVLEESEKQQELSGKAGSFKNKNRTEVSQEYSQDKIRDILREFPKYKNLISDALDIIGHPNLFIMMDDLYFIERSIQPKLVNYFHKITKDTKVYIKVATVKNRSTLYNNEDYVGAEVGHDIQKIDLDYTLDKFEALRNFMDRLVQKSMEEGGAKNIDKDSLFAGDGFETLCLASGGVPRDFLTIFRTCIDNHVIGREQKIGVKQVRRQAQNRIESKKSHLREDAGPEADILEAFLNRIQQFVYRDERRNAFLVAKEELDQYPQSRQAIRELVDLRLIHLLHRNTSKAPSDGRQYKAYMIDMGLYDNTKPYDFTEVRPGMTDKNSRKPKLRSSPVLPLGDVEDEVREDAPTDELMSNAQSIN